MQIHERAGFPWGSSLWAIAGLVLGIPALGIVLGSILQWAGILAPASRQAATLDSATVFATLVIAAICWLGLRHLRKLLSWLCTPGPLQLDPEGLKLGRRPTIAYGEIATLQYDRPDDILILRLAQSRVIKLYLSHWSESEGIVEWLGEKVCDYLLPDALRRLASGETLHFGPVAMKQDGILRRGRVVPWCDVQRIRIESVNSNMGGLTETLLFMTNAGGLKFETSKILNETVMHACLNHYLERVGMPAHA